MERRALNASGGLGSLYDARRDQVIKEREKNPATRKVNSSEPGQCQLMNGNDYTDSTILHRIGLEDELILSLLLNLTRRDGIAAVLRHPHEINQRTRFLFYYWIQRKEHLVRNTGKSGSLLRWSKNVSNPTHFVSSVTFGIDALIVLHLPIETERIDKLLSRTRRFMQSSEDGMPMWSVDEINLLKTIENTKVYSNIHQLNVRTDIINILDEIHFIKMNPKYCRPVRLSLEPIAQSRFRCHRSYDDYSISSQLIDRIKEYLLRYRRSVRALKAAFFENIPDLFHGSLTDQLGAAQSQWFLLEHEYLQLLNRWKPLVIDARYQRTMMHLIDRELDYGRNENLESYITRLEAMKNILAMKGRFINYMRQQHFEYWNTNEKDLERHQNLKNIESAVLEKNPHYRVLCSSDNLNQHHPDKLDELRQLLLQQQKSDVELHLVYLDFTGSKIPIQDMHIFPKNKVVFYPKRVLAVKDPQQSLTQSIVPPAKDSMINILLLGATGVGKSTFINAFANYLTFSSLQHAQAHDPVVLIPVSFIITTGHNFDEHTITFGQCDPSNNEHFNNHGQSATQQCRSYRFDLPLDDQGKRRQVNIIDTPGFGDTRGLDQDARNMQHILHYIAQLSHLNGICLLLKPNESRLNIYFRSCFHQLFSLLGEHICSNVVFAFTNARSTFYSPGNTGPLLRKMLSTLEMGAMQMEMKKQNTFCLDNESFRYLVARGQGIDFSNEEQREYEVSWVNSRKESIRLIDYIHTDLTVYSIQGCLQSIKHAQLEISLMIEPMSEAMRNLLRNMIIYEKDASHGMIRLRPETVWQTATHCRSCKPELQQIGPFLIGVHQSHEISAECSSCSCPLDQHYLINYRLEYEFSSEEPSENRTEMKDRLRQLCEMSVVFARFLRHTISPSEEDPFWMVLTRMTTEERGIAKSQPSKDFNKKLCEALESLKDEYKQRKHQMLEEPEQSDLPALYRLMEIVNEHPMLKVQMIVVRKTLQSRVQQSGRDAQTF